jgi:hypothetical protein
VRKDPVLLRLETVGCRTLLSQHATRGVALATTLPMLALFRVPAAHALVPNASQASHLSEQHVVVSVPLATVTAALVLIHVSARQPFPACAFHASHLLLQHAVPGLAPPVALGTRKLPAAQSLSTSHAAQEVEQHVVDAVDTCMADLPLVGSYHRCAAQDVPLSAFHASQVDAQHVVAGLAPPLAVAASERIYVPAAQSLSTSHAAHVAEQHLVDGCVPAITLLDDITNHLGAPPALHELPATPSQASHLSEQHVVVSVPAAIVAAALFLIQVSAKQPFPASAFHASHLLLQHAVPGLAPATVVEPLNTGKVPAAQLLPAAVSQASHLSEQHVARNLAGSPPLAALEIPAAPALSHELAAHAQAAPPHSVLPADDDCAQVCARVWRRASARHAVTVKVRGDGIAAHTGTKEESLMS